MNVTGHAVRSPEDLLRFVAATLDAVGEPFATGVDVNLDPLFSTLGGEEAEHVRLNSLWDRAKALGWLDDPPWIAEESMVRLTQLGAEAARKVYLTVEAQKIAKRKVLADLERDHGAASDALSVAIAGGGGLTGEVEQRGRQSLDESVGRRAAMAATVWMEVLRGQGCTLHPRIADEVLEAIAEALPTACADLLRLGEEEVPGFNRWKAKDLAAAVDRAIDHVGVDLDHCAVVGFRRDEHPVMQVGSQIYVSGGTVGSLQAGPNSTSHVTQNLGFDAAAFTAALEKLARIPDLPPNAAELLRSAIAEAQKPAPSGFRLLKLIGAFSDSVQGIVAWPHFVDLVLPLLLGLGSLKL